jgi:hypothetical protein
MSCNSKINMPHSVEGSHQFVPSKVSGNSGEGESEKSGSRGARVRFRILIGAIAAGSLVAGCGGGGDKRPPVHTTSPSLAPAAKALTETQARAVLTRYARVNNQANAKVSDALLRSNETGPMLEVDLVSNKRIRAKQEKKFESFTYRDPQFFIPRNVSPAWFGVLARSSLGDKEFIVFVDTGGGAYKATVGPWIAKGQKFPAIARNADGSAVAVTTGPAVGIGTTYAAYLTAAAAGKRVPGGISPGPLTSQLGKSWAKSVTRTISDHMWLGGTNWKARPQPVYALKTADGGALVVNTATQSESYAAIGPNVWLEPDSYSGLGPKRYYHKFTGTQLWEFATYAPPQGTASVLADAAHTISATGS